MAMVVVANGSQSCRHLWKGRPPDDLIDDVATFHCYWCPAVAAEVPDGHVPAVLATLASTYPGGVTVVNNPDSN